MLFELFLTIFRDNSHKKCHDFSSKNKKNLFHKSNWNQTKESNVCRRLAVFDVSLHTKFQNIAQEKTENAATCMVLPVRLSAKKIDLFKKVWFVISSLRNVTFKADSFEIITMVRYLCFSRVSFSLDVLEKIRCF